METLINQAKNYSLAAHLIQIQQASESKLQVPSNDVNQQQQEQKQSK